MKSLNRLKKQVELGLVANPVAVPELSHLFEEGEPNLFYIASLNGIDRDKLTHDFIAYSDLYELTGSQRQEIFRTFASVYCLCDANNVREAQSLEEIVEIMETMKSISTRIVDRLWVVANGANRFSGIEEGLKKTSQVQTASVKKEGGSGESQSTSDSPQDPLG